MTRPQITLAPLPHVGDGTPPVGLFVSGILVTRVKAVIADAGADVLVVLPAGSIAVELPTPPAVQVCPCGAPERAVCMSPLCEAPRIAYPTDGQA